MQNKPKGKPPKTAMGSRVHSSQRHLAESNSNSDSEAEDDPFFAADSKGGGIIDSDAEAGAKDDDEDDQPKKEEPAPGRRSSSRIATKPSKTSSKFEDFCMNTGSAEGVDTTFAAQPKDAARSDTECVK